MSSNAPSHAKMEHLFRPAYEVKIAAIWLMAAIATPFMTDVGLILTSLTATGLITGGMFIVSILYIYDAKPILLKQFRLTTNRKIFMSVAKLRKINQLTQRNMTKRKDMREVYIGNGFEWGAEHAQRAYQVLDMDSQLSEVKLPFLLKPIVKIMSKETKKMGGSPWVHGMGDEKLIKIVEDTLYGHAFIAGNVGTGKTTLLRLMSINALHLGNVVICLDPKNDKDWRDSIKKEMDYLGIGDQFYHVHPSKPSSSARLPLLKHFTRVTEVADRIAPLMGGAGGNSKPFQDFAYEIIYHTASALQYLGEPIRLTTIQRVISSDRRPLAIRVFKKYFKITLGEGWETILDKETKKIGSPDELEGMFIYYNLLKTNTPNTVVEGMAQFAFHDAAHYAKMVVTLRPVLTALTADPLNELLSPIDDPTVDDPRPIVDLKSVIEKGGCIYISLDSLTDAQSAGYISRLILGEIAAVAGTRYNDDDPSLMRRVTICNDEVHASLENNNALLNILAQGRAALMQMILATQTVSDLESKTDAATAKRFLGLCNNFISMRTTDPATKEYVSEQFSKTSVSQVQSQVGTGSSTGHSMLDFSSSYGERLMKTRENAFPEELLGQLPILQYVARLADGRRLKMRLPILLNDEPTTSRAPWVSER